MVTSSDTLEAAKTVNNYNRVERAWSADRGYIIVAFRDLEAVKAVVNTLQKYDFRMFDANDEWMANGEECRAIHFKHPDREDL